MSLRAGAYAESQGAVHPCASVRKPMVRLFAPGDSPAPEGFEPHPGGRWTRLVRRDEVSRLSLVETDATWNGHEVRVEGDYGDREVTVLDVETTRQAETRWTELRADW